MKRIGNEITKRKNEKNHRKKIMKKISNDKNYEKKTYL